MTKTPVKKTLPAKLLTAEPKAPKRARGHLRVEMIIASTIELLKDHELGDITVMMVAQKAGIGRSSIYEFFPTVGAIFRIIAERYADEIVENTSNLLTDLNSHILTQIVDKLIDGTVEFWNTRPAAAKVHLGSDASFGLRVMIKDFDRTSASAYHKWYLPDWPIAPLAEEDPFRTLSVLQYALFSESVQRHGRITDYFRNETKLVAHAYLSQYTNAITGTHPDGSMRLEAKSTDLI